jgi:hypothetical protein
MSYIAFIKDFGDNMKKMFALLSLLSVSSASYAATLKVGTYSSATCKVSVFQSNGNIVLEVDSPSSQIQKDQVALNSSWQSLNGPGLCTDSDTVGSSAAQSVFAQFSDSAMVISCGGTFAPIEVNLTASLAADGSVLSLTEVQATAAISLPGGVSSGPIKTRNSVDCENLVSQ